MRLTNGQKIAGFSGQRRWILVRAKKTALYLAAEQHFNISIYEEGF